MAHNATAVKQSKAKQGTGASGEAGTDARSHHSIGRLHQTTRPRDISMAEQDERDCNHRRQDCNALARRSTLEHRHRLVLGLEQAPVVPAPANISVKTAEISAIRVS